MSRLVPTPADIDRLTAALQREHARAETLAREKATLQQQLVDMEHAFADATTRNRIREGRRTVSATIADAQWRLERLTPEPEDVIARRITDLFTELDARPPMGRKPAPLTDRSSAA